MHVLSLKLDNSSILQEIFLDQTMNYQPTRLLVFVLGTQFWYSFLRVLKQADSNCPQLMEDVAADYGVYYGIDNPSNLGMGISLLIFNGDGLDDITIGKLYQTSPIHRYRIYAYNSAGFESEFNYIDDIDVVWVDLTLTEFAT